jgi:hypothetical protein
VEAKPVTRPSAIALLILTLITGCAGGPASATLTVLASGAHCGAAEAGVSWIDAGAGRLRVSLGQRPSAGYGLEPAPDAVRRRGDTLHVRLRVTAPAAGAMVAQVLTRPCLELQVSAADYRRIIVETEAGEILGVVAR